MREDCINEPIYLYGPRARHSAYSLRGSVARGSYAASSLLFPFLNQEWAGITLGSDSLFRLAIRQGPWTAAVLVPIRIWTLIGAE